MATIVPRGLGRISSDEYAPLPWRRDDLHALALLTEKVPVQARSAALDAMPYLETRRGTAAMLRAVDEAAGGGFYRVPVEAETDTDAATETFGDAELVVDVQTHMANVTRLGGPVAEALLGFLQSVDPARWAGTIDSGPISSAYWAAEIFGRSQTSVALLSALPGRPGENVLPNSEIAAVRDIVDRYAGTNRVLTHAIVHPNLGPAEIEAMDGIRETARPSGWKVYPFWEPPEWNPPDVMPNGWFLDDDEIGGPLLDKIRAIGPRILCTHKGIAGPAPGETPPGASPRDIGPAAAAYPDITFVVYHSGYDPDPVGEEGPHRDDPQRGVSRLVTSLADAGIGPGGNVYAELGSTWFMMMRRPREAAHVIGKLLASVGEDRILWGTDSIWYGSPQFLIDAFRAFQIPEAMQEEFGYPALSDAAKAKILGTNAAAVYGIDVSTLPPPLSASDLDWLEKAKNELVASLG